MSNNRSKLFLSMAALVVLSGCGGGGGDSSGSQLYTGVFVDSPVDGLRYEGSLGSAGVTTDGGRFTYRDGEVVTFSAGNVVLGAAPVTATDGIVTPVDVVAFRRGVESVAVTDPQVLTIVKMLMSADSDDNPANGIQLAAETVAKLSDKAPVRLDERVLDDRELAEYLEEDEHEIVDEREAAEHLGQTVASLVDEDHDDMEEKDEEMHEQEHDEDDGVKNDDEDDRHEDLGEEERDDEEKDDDD